MLQILHLEYTCTKAERDEAKTLHERQELGRGSKWRTRLVLLGLAVVMGLEFYVRILRDVRPAYWPVWIGGVLGVAALLVVLKHVLLKDPSAAVKLDVSTAEITVLGNQSNVTFPWSSFRQCLESENLFVLVNRSKSALIMLPKRAFPSESWQTWFREQAKLKVNQAEPAPAPAPLVPPTGTASPIRLKWKVGYRDYVVRMITSWRIWAFFLFMALLSGVIVLFQALHPDPAAVNSPGKVYFLFMLPILLGIMPVAILVISFVNWRSYAKYHGPQEVAFSEESIAFTGADGYGTTDWASYKFYKETPWSFVLWQGLQSMMFPKRAFATPGDLRRFRDLLARHLRRSRWFFG